MSKEEKKTEEKKDQSEAQPVKSMLDGIDGAPTQDQIDQWKVEHGDVYVSGFSATEVFIFRSLMRPEYLQIQQGVAEGKIPQSEIEETTCTTCVLWPAGIDWSKSKAGTPVALSEFIMQNSNFVNPQAGSYIVAKL